MKIFKLLFIIQLFLFVSYCHALDHYLLDSQGLIKSSYIKDKPFKSGDRLIFGDKDIFIFKEELGQGNTTSVLRVSRVNSNEEFALRIPQTSTRIKDMGQLLDYLNDYVRGHRELYEQSIPVPGLIEYREDQYALMTIEKFNFSYSDLFNPMSKMPESIKGEAEDALFEFARKAAMFKVIGDFHSEQLVYNADTKQWILLDWTDSHYKAYMNNDEFFLSSRLAVSEVRQSSHIYEARYGHAMPRNMIHNYLQEINDFFSDLQDVVKRQRVIFLASDQELLINFINRLNNSENIVESYKNIPIFKTAAPMDKIRSDFDSLFLSSKAITSTSFDDLAVIYSKLDYGNQESFIKRFDLILSKITNIDQLIWVIKHFSTISLSDENKQYVNKAIELLWSNLDLGDESTLVQRTNFLHRSDFLSNEQKRKLRKMTKQTSLQTCLQSFRRFLK